MHSHSFQDMNMQPFTLLLIFSHYGVPNNSWIARDFGQKS